MGNVGQQVRNSSTATAVAVLQATTIKSMPLASNKSAMRRHRSRT
jgi:hypothetical protein